MVKALALICLFFSTFLCFCQSFEAERGGFYFFAPSKSGFVGISTVALNIGVGEYVSSGNTVTTFYKDGSKMGSSSVDCRDGMTTGFANPENDYSYLLSYFVNTKNSVYKLIIYQADKEADLNRVTVNLKSQFNTILGRGKYVLDLKYAVATNDSFVFIFSKYQDKVESFYLVQIKNSNNSIRIEDLGVKVSDAELKSEEKAVPEFLYDGMRSIYVLQLNQKKSNYWLSIKSYGLSDLELVKEREVELQFANKDLFFCNSDGLDNSRSHESGFGTVIDRGNVLVQKFLKYDFFKGNIMVTGLFCKEKPDALKKTRADGIFNARIVKDIDSVVKIDVKMNFKYVTASDPTPDYYTAFGVSSFFWSFLKHSENTIWVSKNALTPLKVNVKKGGVEQALISVLDEKNEIPEKYLKEDKSKLIETLKSFYCLYNTNTNSVGYYTKFTLKEFPK